MTARAIVEFFVEGWNKRFYIYFDNDGYPEDIKPIFEKVLDEIAIRQYNPSLGQFVAMFLLLANDRQCGNWTWGEIADWQSGEEEYRYFVHWEDRKGWIFEYSKNEEQTDKSKKKK
jgi:hypothetical protein